jgi:hypothetical protein
MKNLTKEQIKIKIIKDRLFCLTEDAKKFGGFVTVLTFYDKKWNGKTYQNRALTTSYKGY